MSSRKPTYEMTPGFKPFTEGINHKIMQAVIETFSQFRWRYLAVRYNVAVGKGIDTHWPKLNSGVPYV